MKYVYHSSLISRLTAIEGRIAYSYPKLGKVVFASYNKSFAAIFATHLRDDSLRVVTTNTKDIMNMKIEIEFLRPIKSHEINHVFSIYKLDSKPFKLVPDHLSEVYASNDQKIIEEEIIPNWFKYIQTCSNISIKGLNHISKESFMNISNYKFTQLPDFKESTSDQAMDDIDPSLLPQPSTPEDDDNKKELEPYVPKDSEQSDLLKELESLSDTEANQLRLQVNGYIDHHLRELRDIQIQAKVSTEGFFEHPWMTLRNISSSIISKFKILFVLSLRDLKRSELKAEKDKHAGSFNEVLNKQMYDLKGISLPYPTGMEKITYYEGIQRLEAFYTSIQMKSLAPHILKDVNDLIHVSSALKESDFSDGSISNEKFNNIVHTTPIDMNVLKRMFLPLLDINKDIISKAKQIETQNEKLFIQLFKNVQEFKDTYNAALDMEDRFKEISSIFSTLQNIQVSTDKFITELEKKKIKLSNQAIGNISKYIENLAEIFDMYAQGVHQHQRVDHNLTEGMKVLIKHFNL